MKPTFSIILPIYNQADHATVLVREYAKILKLYPEQVEILWIVNGSRDNSYQVLTTLTDGQKAHRVFNLKKGGWGLAVLYGLDKARGKFLVYTNSARTNIDNLKLILAYAKVNDSVVVKATRMMRGEGWVRRLGSVLYNLWARLLLSVPVWDVNGTPKSIPAKVWPRLRVTRKDDLIDAELLAECFAKKVPVIEVPISTGGRVGGQSTTKLKSAIKMYVGIYELWKHR